jgi:PleD family two-component response regulator
LIKKNEEQVKKIILAVDDLPSNLTKVKEILSDTYDVRLAKNAPMALSMMNRMDVDLVLLDIEMPGMSGFDFMKELGEDDPRSKVPVIFVTSHASREFVIRAVQAGAKDYIAKPFNRETLRKKVSDVLSGITPGGNLPYPDIVG